MRRPGFLEQLRQFGEDANSPDKQALLRSLIRQRPFARISPKDPYPEDPYRDRTAWPVRPDASGKVTVRSPYGKRWLPGAPGPEFHPGADFDNPIGGDVFAPKNGTILRIEPNSRGGGNQIFILCDDGSIIGISHTKWLEGMQEGDEVYAGQHVGVSDGSGTFSKRDGKLHPHTHISLYPPGTPVDVLLAPPTLKGASPSEEYYSARKPPWNPRDHDISAQTRLQVDPFAPGNLYGDRVHGKHFIIDRS
jgi:murein DD-endopeptidase MepM/ murein hydrolase activator NlpD